MVRDTIIPQRSVQIYGVLNVHVWGGGRGVTCGKEKIKKKVVRERGNRGL